MEENKNRVVLWIQSMEALNLQLHKICHEARSNTGFLEGRIVVQ